MKILHLFSKEKSALDQGLKKTKTTFLSKLSKILVGKSKVDAKVLDALEEVLITSDVGIETTLKIIQRIEKRVASVKYLNTRELDAMLKEEIVVLLTENNTQDVEEFVTLPYQRPYVLLVVGVNGVGKTTTIGKLAAQFKQHDKKVILGAADTFRAAAVDQLKQWGERIGVPIIAHGMHTGPSAVAYDAVKAGMYTQADVVIIDTAGRLHTKVNLMNELAKLKSNIQKLDPQAPHEVLLVLDGSTGQNAFIQAEKFTKAIEVTALAITKLDGTAKGGVVIGISDQFKIPVKYIGIGEKVDDLQIFNKHAFVDALFG